MTALDNDEVVLTRHTFMMRNCCARESLSLARSLASEMLSRNGVDQSAVADAQLVISELVTNAVQAIGEAVVLSLRVDRRTVVIEVADSDPTNFPIRGEPEDDDEHGRGLMILDAIVEDWSVRRTSRGKVVRCCISDGN
ncbi:ATP-binding protein [Streptomyces sp. NPDC127084]|uniref:ATP-binding protein n=1 Tax=Streptomyces sp. NPDC127084 TaxID=3347133 RepID=UPI0036481E6B